MNAMKKRQGDSIFNSLFFGIVYPYFLLRGKIILTMVHVGTVPITLAIIAGLWMTIHSIVRAIKLMKLRKQVLLGESLGSGKEWKKRVRLYHVSNTLRRCVYVIALIVLCKVLGDNILEEKYIPLTEYTGTVPFKTMQDFIPNGEIERMNMKVGNLNTVRAWSDIFSAVNYEWDEAGTVKSTDGTILTESNKSPMNGINKT